MSAAPNMELRTPEQKAAWRTANATVWIAIFTIVLALVGFFTLYEVISGGNDTKKLVKAASNQAEAAERSAYVACVSAQISRNVLTIETQRSGNDTHGAVQAAVAQAMAATASEAAIVTLTLGDQPMLHREHEVGIHFSNIGKTDAKDFEGKLVAVFIPRNSDPNFSYKGRAGKVGARVLNVGSANAGGGKTMAVGVTNADGSEYAAKPERESLGI